ncbi:hypothetical protein [Pseudomonas sp. BF-B-25]|uniref:hypothetical protein n=1 Tax=Pseudomonas sp. BF-B-25 TaxID=2832355 RepID=UPI001CBC6A77|nr:hypothetical protein [Pseudomonas sp. BF-B-25]
MENMRSPLLTEFSLDIMAADAGWHQISRPWIRILVLLDVGQILGLELRFGQTVSSVLSEPAYTWGEALCVQSQDVVIARSDVDLRHIGAMNVERANIHARNRSAAKIRMSYLYLFLEWPSSAYGFGSAISTHSITYSTLISLIEKATHDFNDLKWMYIFTDLR